jgi:hypothetical protein
MDFTFGIVTNGNNDVFLTEIIDSIKKEKIPNYEIIIVGNTKLTENIQVVNFDETQKVNWITKKKNIITSLAKYENIVYLHDYIKLVDGWYQGQILASNDFQVRMDKILNFNNVRYRDWCLWMDDGCNFVNKFNYLIPYEFTHLSKLMYISGAYWVAKKDFMLENPLNEKLSWGQSEDVEWSLRIRNKIEFKLNNYSYVKLLKIKDRVFNEPSVKEIEILKQIENYDNSQTYEKLIKNHIPQFI